MDPRNRSQTEVLSGSGFVPFDGIVRKGEKKTTEFEFDDGTVVWATSDHLFETSDGFMAACFLEIGEKVGDKVLVSIGESREEIVYDLLGVEGHQYLTEGVPSHNCNLVYLDEFAFVEHDVEFMTSTYPVISSGKKSKVIITSTANGIGNEFHRLYQGAVDGKNTYVPFRVDWWDVPGRDERWKKEQIANTSAEQFNQEFGNQFIGSSDTLIDAKTLIRLRSDLPLWTSNDGTKVYEKPVDGRSYVMTVDVAKGRGKDYSTFTVIDVTDLPYRQVATYRDSTISPMWFPNVVSKWGEAYNDAFVVVESNDEGITVCRGLYYDIEYENMFNESMIKSGKLGVEVTKKVKRIGCSKFKDILESDKLWIRDPDSIKELTTFVQKGTSYEASDANHDDMVSNLWLFGWVTDLDDFDEISKGINLKDAMFGDDIENLAEELFFGVVDDGIDDEDLPTTVNF